ncbi:hypothetical protein [Anabaena sp. PCC 7108]|uniref:hypothetical protein n=1 Tax=Anabaena sp. PCC 7108 TaxID=163908 RepID=UPI001ED9A6D5|nr:hypothetical protein [Anabaena sp. PCC 7108]
MTAAGITLSAESAQALNFTLAPGNFSVTQGIGDNNASSGIAINTQAPSNGFGGLFTSNFLLLGANSNDANIPNDSLRNNNSTATSIPFAISSTDADQPITVTFNWAFQGNATGVINDADSFSIVIQNTDPNANDAAIIFQRTLVTTDSIPGYGSVTNQTGDIIPANSLTPGDYEILISLNENTNNRSSAAGFNNITVSTPGTPVPFGFSTNMSLLAFGGMFYGMNQLKKKMAVKKFQA